ncbi:MAG: hypothetical protein C4530_02325 [Desulfobacteraceae bacterium]|nr:MAG: hypothetical protein C4530_02325 [Desulfobacteraceae bacterium]
MTATKWHDRSFSSWHEFHLSASSFAKAARFSGGPLFFIVRWDAVQGREVLDFVDWNKKEPQNASGSAAQHTL